MKITFLGAGSTVFVRNLIGDCMQVEALQGTEFALYDIDAERLKQSLRVLEGIREKLGAEATFTCHCGVAKRKDAMRGASFVINAVQIGGYEPTFKSDFSTPNKYDLRQTIGDTVGVGGIIRALRTIPVLEDFTRDMAEVCPDALFLNYTNPMAILSGYLQRYTPIKTVGLCHSVQVCSKNLMTRLHMEDYMEGRRETIFGINHMAWLVDIRDKDGNDLYPEIKRRIEAHEYEDDCGDLVRFDYIRRLGYYCTESSTHQAEYNPFYIKRNYPELLERYRIPLDDYIRRAHRNIDRWNDAYDALLRDPEPPARSREYASRIIEAMVTNVPYRIHGNVLNTGNLIDELPTEACVEVPILVDGMGLHPCKMGALPLQCAAMCRGRINMELLTIKAARTHSREDVYRAAMFDPHTAAELSIDDIRSVIDDLLADQQYMLPEYN